MRTGYLNLCFFILLLADSVPVSAQTKPPAWVLANSSFEFSGFENQEDTEFPLGMQGWTSTGYIAPVTGAEPGKHQANGDALLHPYSDSGYPKNFGETGIRLFVNHHGKVPNMLAIAVNTKGCTGVSVKWVARGYSNYSAQHNTNLELQYRIGTTGDWTSLNAYKMIGLTGTDGDSTYGPTQLPASCENQPVVQFRWFIYDHQTDDDPYWTTTCPVNLDDVTVNAATKILQPPVAGFEAADTTSLTNEPLAFKNLSMGLPTNFYWDFGDGQTDSTFEPSHTYQTMGTYTVKLVVSNSAGADSMVKENYITVSSDSSETTGMNTSYDDGMLLYPNPASIELVINYPIKNTVEAELISSTGKLVRRIVLMKGSNCINVSDLPPSLYIVKLKGGKHITTHRLQVIH